MHQKAQKKSHGKLYFFAIILVAFLVFWLHPGSSHANSDAVIIKSGTQNFCLDVLHDGNKPSTAVDSYKCNHSDAQNFEISVDKLKHDSLCIGTTSTKPSNKITLATCDNSPGQIWLRDRDNYYNPASTLCMNTPGDKTNQQLVLGDCNQSSWTPIDSDTGSAYQAPTCTGNEQQKVACTAEQEWTRWQSSDNHSALLNTYTDGASYEEWCADFVSYIYKQAGYPFTKGETDGWNENLAARVQYMGFTKHIASSGYVPQTGDVAFFDYSGGHVEIVVSGGKTPTFVYGNSAEIDPTTGNGQMKANTITQDGDEGKVIYYLSPINQ